MRRFATALSLILFSVILFFIAGEIYFRILGHRDLYATPERQIFWKYHPLLGWHHRPGQSGSIIFGASRSYVSMNSRGLRDSEHSYKRANGRGRILILGDSFAWGLGVNQQDVFSKVLERHLSHVEVINAGVSGYSTDQELLWLEMEGKKYSPDLIILTFCENDLVGNTLSKIYHVYYKPKFLLSSNGHLKLENVPVPRMPKFVMTMYHASLHSAFMNFISTKVFQLNKKYFYSRGVVASHEEQSKITIALIDKMESFSKSIHAKFVIVATTRKEPSEPDLNFISLLEHRYPYVVHIQSTSGYNADQMTIPRDEHWNKMGHAFVASQIMKYIKENRLLASDAVTQS